MHLHRGSESVTGMVRHQDNLGNAGTQAGLDLSERDQLLGLSRSC